MERVELEKAFIAIVRQYERVIYKVCSFYASNESPIADLYQEVVCSLWTAYPKFRNECALSTWIYRIALNTCITGVRKDIRQPKATVPVAMLAESLPETESMEENIREMYRLIEQLKTIEKAIILLYLEEKTYQEIADITGLTVSNVATKLKRIKEKLKQMSNL
jgi:RNA polymerase sigma-70 factor (ECF subfamily)